MGIASLLDPRSIAIVGASEKVGPGYNAFKALEFVGFKGRIDLATRSRRSCSAGDHWLRLMTSPARSMPCSSRCKQAPFWTSPKPQPEKARAQTLRPEFCAFTKTVSLTA
jgi:hypothetical protein